MLLRKESACAAACSSNAAGRGARRGTGPRAHTRFIVAMLVAAAVLVAGLLPAIARADTISAALPGFDSTNIQLFHLNGGAQLSGSSLRLNQSSPNQWGTGWWLHKVYLHPDRSFSAAFSFHIADPVNDGADGLTFAIQQTSNEAGASGGGMGYEYTQPSAAVEFDTWVNGDFGDQDENHVGLDVNGSMHSLAQAPAPFDMSSGQECYAWVDYNGATHLLEVRLNDSPERPADPLFSYTIDLASVVSQEVYIGFTASTGGSWEEHDIDGFYFNNDYTPLDPQNVTYTMPAVSTITLSAAPAAIVNPGDTTLVTATAKDELGNPVAGQTITFMSAQGSFDSTTAVTDANGQATVQFTSAPEVGFETVSARVDGGAYGEDKLMVGNAPPVTTASGLGSGPDAPWQTGWGSQVTFTADDGSGPGVAGTFYTVDGGPTQPYFSGWPLQITGDGAHVVTYWSEDLLGRTETAQTGYVNIDHTAPTVTLDGVHYAWPWSWQTTAQQVTVTADDGAGSGLDGLTCYVDGVPVDCSAPFTISSSGLHSVAVDAADKAGNDNWTYGYVAIDGAPPTTVANGLSADQSYQGNGDVSLWASDDASGVAQTHYRVDKGPWQIFWSDIVITDPGPHTVDYYSVDNAGNTEDVQTGYVTIVPDTTPPTTTAGGLSADQSYQGSGDVSLWASDDASGVAQTYYRIDGDGWQTYWGSYFITDEGFHTVEYYSVDKAGNTEDTQTGYVNVVHDHTPPVTTATGIAAGPSSLFVNHDQTVTLTADDGDGSGVSMTEYMVDGGKAKYSGPFTVKGEGPHRVDYVSVDKAGNWEEFRTGYVTIDETPPKTTMYGLDGADGWSDGHLWAEASDDSSGVAVSYYCLDGGAPQQILGNIFVPAGSHTVDYYSVDNAGNTEDVQTAGVHVDADGPTTTADGIADDPVCVNHDQTVTLTADDGDGSGVAAIYYILDNGPATKYSGPFTVTGEGPHEVQYAAKDNVGNLGVIETGYVTIDDTPPTTTAGGLPDEGVWVDQTPTVTLQATDAGGSGVHRTYYTVDGGDPQTYGAPFDVKGEGAHAVTYWSVDDAGNAEAPHHADVSIDATPPMTTASGVDKTGHLFVNHAQDVTLNATDGGSGVASTSYTVDGGDPKPYTGAIHLSTEGPHTVTFWSVDVAGNLEQAGVGTVTVDTTAPVTTASGLQADDHTGYVHGAQAVTLAASDAGCGMAATHYTVDGGPAQTYGGAFQVSGTGSHTVTYWSVDDLGNVEATKTGYVNIAPAAVIVTTATGVTVDAHSGWTNGARTVTLTASGGVGALTTYYTVDGGARQTYGAPFEVAGEGSHVLTYWSADQEPVVETANAGYVNIDLTAPVTRAAASPAWRNTTLVLPAPATDNLSGVAATSYRIDGGALLTGPVTVPALADHSMDGTHDVSVFSTDVAGNVEAVRHVTVRIDTTKPRIRLKKTLFVWKHGGVATIKYRVSDATVDKVSVQLKVTQFGTPKTKIYRFGLKRCGRWYVSHFRWSLPAYHYNLHLQAYDYAGNLGRKSGLIIIRR